MTQQLTPNQRLQQEAGQAAYTKEMDKCLSDTVFPAESVPDWFGYILIKSMTYESHLTLKCTISEYKEMKEMAITGTKHYSLNIMNLALVTIQKRTPRELISVEAYSDIEIVEQFESKMQVTLEMGDKMAALIEPIHKAATRYADTVAHNALALPPDKKILTLGKRKI